MKTDFLSWSFVSAMCAVIAAKDASAQPNGLRAEPFASGFIRPLAVVAPPGDVQRLFVVEQRTTPTPESPLPRGFIRVVDATTGVALAQPFWSSPPVPSGTSEGILGFVFHPQFATNGKCYVSWTDADRNTIITELQADPQNPNRALPGSERIVFSLWTPSNKHNGGWMSFGWNETPGAAIAQHSLLFAIGDDNIPESAQNITDLRGKILRIDLDGPDNVFGTLDDDEFPNDPLKNYSIPVDNPFVNAAGADEIWVYGLRSPWQPHFDPASQRLFVADVGENDREEITVIQATTAPSNLGWFCYEGTLPIGGERCIPGPHAPIMPQLEYTNTNNGAPAIAPTNIRGCAIIGGPLLPSNFGSCLAGLYLFADYCTGDVFSVQIEGAGMAGAVSNLVNRKAQLDPPGDTDISNITAFGFTGDGSATSPGRVFVIDREGEVFEVLPDHQSSTCRTCSTVDFNGDGLFPEDGDLIDFLSVLAGGECSTDSCDDIDFNNDGLYPSDDDLVAFLRVLAGGDC